MKRKLKNLLCFLCGVCLLIVCIYQLTLLFERKDSVKKYQDFFDEEENFDVLYFGTSHVIASVFPMELWKDYGIVSYNMGGNGNKLPTSYWVMRNALDYTKPKLVVIDGLKMSQDHKTNNKISQMHESFDAFPLTATKNGAIRDLLGPEEIEFYETTEPEQEGEKRSQIGLLWDFSVYHARWEELGRADFDYQAYYEKGASSRVYLSEPQSVGMADPDKRVTDSLGISYLREMIEECQARDIEVLLTYLPFPASVNEQVEANSMQAIADEYGINYVNFLELGVIDYKTDLYDDYSHLNFSGGRKVSSYLGNYIMENYDIPDQRENPAYADWEEDYEEYKNYKYSRLMKQEELDLFLMLLQDSDFDCIMEINTQTLRSNPHLRDMFANLGFTVQDLMCGVHYYFVNGETKEIERFATPSDFHMLETAKGSYYFEPSGELGIRITVFDGQSGEELGVKEFQDGES